MTPHLLPNFCFLADPATVFQAETPLFAEFGGIRVQPFEHLLANLPPTPQWLAVGVALLIGLLLGGLFWKRRTATTPLVVRLPAEKQSAPPSRRVATLQNSRGLDNFEGAVETHISSSNAITGFKNGTLGLKAFSEKSHFTTQLKIAQASTERHRAESEASKLHVQSLDAQLSSQSLNVLALASAVETALRGKVASDLQAIALAQASAMQLAESVRIARRWTSSAIIRLESLQRRLRACEERLWSTTEEIQGFQEHLASANPDGSNHLRDRRDRRDQLRSRLCEVDEQIRIYHQHLRGCLSVTDSLRSDLQPEIDSFRSASSAANAVSSRLEELFGRRAETVAIAMIQRDPRTEPASFSVDTLAEAENRLAVATDCLSQIDTKTIQHAAETLERCEWVALDAALGLRDSITRLGECDQIDDLALTVMLSRIWRKLSEVEGRLDNLSVVAESGQLGQSPRVLSTHNFQKILSHVSDAISSVRSSAQTRKAAAIVPDRLPLPASEGSKLGLHRESSCKGDSAKATPPSIEFPSLGALTTASRGAIGIQNCLTPPDASSFAATELSFSRGYSLHPGDFVRRLVGLSENRDETPETIRDTTRAPQNFGDAQARLSCLRFTNSLPLGSTGISYENVTAKSLQAAFENTIRRCDEATFTMPHNDLGMENQTRGISSERGDLKRLGTASEELLSAVALKKRQQNIDIGAPAKSFDATQENLLTATSAAHQDPPKSSDSSPASASRATLGARDSTVIFCGNDPTLWGRTIYQSERRRALDISDLPFDPSFLRLQRLDTGAAVLLAIELHDIIPNSESTPKKHGFHAANECYYGARHLGIFSESIAAEVEVRLTYGGWGFGHSNSSADENRQFCGWSGLEIPNDTVLEITVFLSRPEPLVGEQFLG